MNLSIREALLHYKIDQPEIEFIRHNENATYKVTDLATGRAFVVRIHQPNTNFSLELLDVQRHSAAALQSEMELIESLALHTDIAMQIPQANRSGNFVTLLADGTPATVLSWIDGETIEKAEITTDILCSIGWMVGKMHAHFADAGSKRTYDRYAYDQVMVDRIQNKVDFLFADRLLAETHYIVLSGALAEIRARMTELDDQPGAYGLVHSDLAKSNLILHHDSIVPIDFCLCGYSHYYMDIGSLYAHFTRPDEQALIKDCYEKITGRQLDPHFIEPFVAMQVLLFLISSYERIYQLDWFPGALNRWCDAHFKPLIK